MARIYNLEKGEIFIKNLGWIPYREYCNKPYEEREQIEITQYSPLFIDESGITGNEDYSIERWKELNLKHYIAELRTYKKGKGFKRVADNIHPIGVLYGNKKDITNYIKREYENKINQGYEIVITKF